MDPFTRYNSYLSQIMQAQEIADKLNAPQTGILSSSVVNTVPEDEGIMTLGAETQQTNNPTATNTNVNYRDVLSFMMNPGFFAINKGVGALSPTGRTLTDRIADLFTNRKATTFGDGIGESVADSPGMNFGSGMDDPSLDAGDSGGGTSGADAASAAGANDDASTGGPF